MWQPSRRGLRDQVRLPTRLVGRPVCRGLVVDRPAVVGDVSDGQPLDVGGDASTGNWLNDGRAGGRTVRQTGIRYGERVRLSDVKIRRVLTKPQLDNKDLHWQTGVGGANLSELSPRHTRPRSPFARPSHKKPPASPLQPSIRPSIEIAKIQVLRIVESYDRSK